MLRFLATEEVDLRLEKVHNLMCKSHVGRMALVSILLRVRYYWPEILRHNFEFVNKSDKCQRFSNFTDVLAEVLHLVTLPFPFYQWGRTSQDHSH